MSLVITTNKSDEAIIEFLENNFLISWAILVIISSYGKRKATSMFPYIRVPRSTAVYQLFTCFYSRSRILFLWITIRSLVLLRAISVC